MANLLRVHGKPPAQHYSLLAMISMQESSYIDAGMFPA
jgi:hypothetical protein